MKKQRMYLVLIVLLIGLSSSGCLTLSTSQYDDFQKTFFGTWHYPKNNIFYTISGETLVAYMPGDNTGFTARISKWEYVENSQSDRGEYPKGYTITAKMEKMTGGWWIEVGDTDTWTWYMHNDKKSIVTASGTVYFKR